jgi:GNAT superfamily N-acetyltransferase
MIRRGKIEDLADALNLIKELALYEKAPQEVTVTLPEMHQWGFGEDKIFDFFVAEVENKIVGLALYYYKYSTWKGKSLFLEDIIVTENYRGRGIGKKLFEVIADEAKRTGSRRMEWQVLDWNTPAIKFYEKYDAYFDSEWINCKLSDEQLKKGLHKMKA